MKQHSAWWSIVIASFAAFAVGPLISSFAYAVVAAVQGDTWPIGQILAGAASIYVYSLIFGFLPFLFVGVPLFGYLRTRGKASYLTVGAVGVLPGAAIAPFSPWQFGLLFLVFGLVVSLLAQFFANRWEALQHAT